MLALFALTLASLTHAEPLPTCAGLTTKLTAPSGTFTDGSAAKEDYRNGADDCFLIAPRGLGEGREVELTFDRVDVETGYDRLMIYDLADGTLIEKDAVQDFTWLSTRGFLVRFLTDESVVKTGFAGSWAVGTAGEADEIPLEMEILENAKT